MWRWCFPHDAARRITETSKISQLGRTTHYGLFGTTSKRGHSPRDSRVWTISQAPQVEALDRYEKFLGEPLPLGI